MTMKMSGQNRRDLAVYEELGVRAAAWDIMRGKTPAPRYQDRALQRLGEGFGALLIRDRARLNEKSPADICRRDQVLPQWWTA